MYFLLGVLILIFFFMSVYIYFSYKFKEVFGSNLWYIIKEARLQDEIRPKSLSSMDSIYLKQLMEDFPEINIDEFKSDSEKYILDYLFAVENKDSSKLNGKIKSVADSKINDLDNKEIKFENVKFHNRVLDKYNKANGFAIITIGCSFEYIKKENGKDKRIQDRARLQYIYVTQYDKVDYTKKSFSINCPNCGSPYVDYKNKRCSYCGSLVQPLVKNVWVLNDIKFY